MRKLFLPLLAAFALVGCSESDEPVNTGSSDYGYVAVNIVQPASGSRDASDGFEYGTEVENYAQQGLFFIFDAAGSKRIGAPQRLALSASDKTENTPEVEKIYNAVLVIDGDSVNPAEKANLQIVCVLNAPAGIESNVETLSALTSKIANYDAHTRGTFIMTNSVYRDSLNNEVIGTVVTKNDVKPSPSEALASPVKIYVERVVAKVNVKTADPFTSTPDTTNIDGVKKIFDINIKGLEIANIADSAYLIKNINNIDALGLGSWVWDPKNKRSYWEICPSPLTYSNRSYNVINGNTPGTDGVVPDYDITKANLTEYIQPNTTTQKTSVLVTAQLTDKETGAPYSFVYLKGGYFTPEGALNLIASYLANNGNFWLKTNDTTYVQLPAVAFEWKNKNDLKDDSSVSETQRPTINALKDYEVVARLKASFVYEGTTFEPENIYVKNGNEYTALTDAAPVNEALLAYIAQYWNNGMCYYFMEIDQTSVATDNGYAGTDKFYGVVRNHIYKLTLNSIKGLGTPVFDPDDVIIPVRREDEELWYLAATVEVLAWKVASQTVDFDM